MTDPDRSDDAAAGEVNRLYWGSDRSVNGIADDLGISKGVLYQLMEPLETRRSCSGCGAGTVYRNRTARQRGVGTCPSCGAETTYEVSGGGVDVADGAGAGKDDRAAVPERAGRDAAAFSSWNLEGGGAKVLASAALVGVAAGILLSAVLRRRS